MVREILLMALFGSAAVGSMLVEDGVGRPMAAAASLDMPRPVGWVPKTWSRGEWATSTPSASPDAALTSTTIPSARHASERFERVSERWFAKLARWREPEIYGRVSRQRWDLDLLQRALAGIAAHGPANPQV